MKKLEIIIRPERLDDLKVILNNNNAHGLMITNIMGYGSQKGHPLPERSSRPFSSSPQAWAR